MSKTRIRLLLCALVAALLALPGAAAHAAPTMGVNVANYPDDGTIQAALATGAKTIRMFVNWSDLEPTAAGQFPSNEDHDHQATVDALDHIVHQINAGGAKPLIVLWRAPSWANNSNDPYVPPANPTDYANFAGAVAKRYAGMIAGYEIWNEEDADAYWHDGTYDPATRAAQYAPLLTAAYGAIHAADPGATVLAGPLTGNDYPFLQALYNAGAAGSFDAVAVHTDTACLVAAPDQYYRDPNNGNRIGQYSFLGYREVHKTMADNGDGDKPIWMSEIGWSSTNGSANSCQRGASTGQKPSGVSQAVQAQDLTDAVHCMSQDPYLQQADWFTFKDSSGGSLDEFNHYGLLATDGSHKPVWTAFHTAATQGDTGTGTCGDFDGPSVSITSPTGGTQFAGQLQITAKAHDPSQVARITYKVDGTLIRNFTSTKADDVNSSLTWEGSKNLSPGAHTITVQAVDIYGNVSTDSVVVTKVAAGAIQATAKTAVSLKKLHCKGRTCTIAGKVTAANVAGVGLGGKIQALWQWKNKKGQWKTLHKGAKNANKPFTLTQHLRKGGRWRLQVSYLGQAPFKPGKSAYIKFAVK